MKIQQYFRLRASWLEFQLRKLCVTTWIENHIIQRNSTKLEIMFHELSSATHDRAIEPDEVHIYQTQRSWVQKQWKSYTEVVPSKYTVSFPVCHTTTLKPFTVLAEGQDHLTPLSFL